MNVTLKIPDELCQAARHRAVDEKMSLSAWMATILKRELNCPTAGPKPLLKTWMDAFSGEEDDEHLDRDFPLEDRHSILIREVSFED